MKILPCASTPTQANSSDKIRGGSELPFCSPPSSSPVLCCLVHLGVTSGKMSTKCYEFADAVVPPTPLPSPRPHPPTFQTVINDCATLQAAVSNNHTKPLPSNGFKSLPSSLWGSGEKQSRCFASLSRVKFLLHPAPLGIHHSSEFPRLSLKGFIMGTDNNKLQNDPSCEDRL